MQNISLHNYRDFLLRYIDEELDLRQTEALLAFVALHPEVQQELESLQSTKLDIEIMSCPNKAVLYKNMFPVIVAPETIVYPNKQKLFKKEKEKAPVVLLKWWAVGAAAVFILMVVRFGMLDQKTSSTTSKNSISKNKVLKAFPISNIKNNTTTNNSTINNSVANTGSWTATKIVADKNNNTSNDMEYAAAQNIEHQSIPTVSSITTRETAQTTPSYHGDIIDVKPTIIAEITMPSFAGNDETIETYETIDTEAASSNRTVMVGAFEIDKDKFRGLFRKVNAIIKNKENNKNEK